MALRLRPTTENTTVKKGFTITINRSEENVDLDELFQQVSRTNSENALIIQNINSDDKSRLEEAYKELSTEIGKILNPILETTDVKEAIDQIIDNELSVYNYKIEKEEDINTRYFLEVIKESIAKKISAYINNLDGLDDETKGTLTTTLKFNINNNGEIDVNIDYDLDSTVQANKLLDIYNRILANNSEANNIQVGGLAIDGRRDLKVNITADDYQKYLLSEEKSTQGYTEPGTKRPLIIWTDATEDTNPNVGSDPMSLLDEIDYLKEVIRDLKSKAGTEELPPLPDGVGEYVLQVRVTKAGEVKSWVMREDLALSGIRIEENLDGTYTLFIGNTSLEILENGERNIIAAGIVPVLVDSTYAIFVDSVTGKDIISGTDSIIDGIKASTYVNNKIREMKDELTQQMEDTYKNKGDISVDELNTIPRSELVSGWTYNITTRGNLRIGNVGVRPGDNVTWTGDSWDRLSSLSAEPTDLDVKANRDEVYTTSETNSLLDEKEDKLVVTGGLTRNGNVISSLIESDDILIDIK